MTRLSFAVALVLVTASPAHAVIVHRVLGEIPPQVIQNPSAWLHVTLSAHQPGPPWSLHLTVRDQHTTWRTVEHVDGQGDFWIARTTPAFRLTHAFFFYDTPSGDWMPGADYLGGNKWLSTHDISAYLSAPSLTIEASKPDGASPHARGATWQTFRYNGDIVRLSVKTAPEPAGFSMAAAAALILLHYRRRHVDGAARLA